MNRYKMLFVLLGLLGLLAGSQAQAAVELINNGTFELGNTGFGSGYTYVVPPIPSPGMLDLNQYTVYTDPHGVHPSWYSFGDHTTGAGQMMIVNGSTDSDKVVWSQDVALTAGVTYEFSAWATGVFPEAPADLQFEIDGQGVIGNLLLSTTVPQWMQFSATYTAGATGSFQLAIRDLEEAYSGNDLALDDISLKAQVPEPAALAIWSLLAGVGVMFGWRRRKRTA